MNLLERWIETPGAAALGRALAHSLWEGTLVALALATVLCLVRSARGRYAAGCLAMATMVCLFGLTLVRMLPEAGPPPDRGRAAVSGAETAISLWFGTTGPQQEPAGYLPWLAPVWLAGVLLFHVRSARGWMAARRLQRIGVCKAPELWQGRLDHLGSRLRVSRPVILLESCLAEAPVVFGHLRPVILIPVGLLAGLPAGQVEAILLHELAHVRRRDYIVNLLQIFVEDVFFYHPAVWWISRVVRSERENCCDDAVVAATGGAYEYATALAALEQNRAGLREAMAASGGDLAKRIRRLLQAGETAHVSRTPVIAAAMLTVVLGSAVVAWQARPADPPPQPKMPRLSAQLKQEPLTLERRRERESQPRAELATPYSKWLAEDVAYTVTDEERGAFLQLRTDAERERFITQFWLRRDPTPGTVENEMKMEHYRRIAYANEHFSAGIPGWKTDRGRIYTIYGPPDEKESHPAGGLYNRPPEQGGGVTSTYPFEQWRYAWIEGMGANVVVEFVDPTLSGEYRMTLDPHEKDALLQARGIEIRALGPKAGANVQVMGNSAIMISAPLDAYGDHQINVYWRVVTSEGRRTVNLREDSIKGPAPFYTRMIPISPGNYVLEFLIKDVTTGKTAGDNIEFQVK